MSDAAAKVNEVPSARMIHERETARDIISMLRAFSMAYKEMPLSDFRNKYCPGLEYAVELIEAAYHLNTVGKND